MLATLTQKSRKLKANKSAARTTNNKLLVFISNLGKDVQGPWRAVRCRCGWLTGERSPSSFCSADRLQRADRSEVQGRWTPERRWGLNLRFERRSLRARSLQADGGQPDDPDRTADSPSGQTSGAGTTCSSLSVERHGGKNILQTDR